MFGNSEMVMSLRVGAKDETQAAWGSAHRGLNAFIHAASKPVTVPIKIAAGAWHGLRAGMGILRDIEQGVVPVVAAFDRWIERAGSLNVIQKNFVGLAGIGEGRAMSLGRALVAATRGTIGMREAMIEANEMMAADMPIRDLPTIFEFATKRAAAFGEEAGGAIRQITAMVHAGQFRGLKALGIDLGDVARQFEEMQLGGKFSAQEFTQRRAEVIAAMVSRMREEMDRFSLSTDEPLVKWRGLKREISDAADSLLLAALRSEKVGEEIGGYKDVVSAMARHFREGGGVGDLLFGKAGGTSEGVLGFFKAGLSDGWNAMVGGVRTLFREGVSVFKEEGPAIWEGFKDAASKSWTGFADAAATAWLGLKSVLAESWELMKEKIKEAWRWIKGQLSKDSPPPPESPSPIMSPLGPIAMNPMLAIQQAVAASAMGFTEQKPGFWSRLAGAAGRAISGYDFAGHFGFGAGRKSWRERFLKDFPPAATEKGELDAAEIGGIPIADYPLTPVARGGRMALIRQGERRYRALTGRDEFSDTDAWATRGASGRYRFPRGGPDFIEAQRAARDEAREEIRGLRAEGRHINLRDEKMIFERRLQEQIEARARAIREDVEAQRRGVNSSDANRERSSEFDRWRRAFSEEFLKALAEKAVIRDPELGKPFYKNPNWRESYYGRDSYDNVMKEARDVLKREGYHFPGAEGGKLEAMGERLMQKLDAVFSALGVGESQLAAAATRGT